MPFPNPSVTTTTLRPGGQAHGLVRSDRARVGGADRGGRLLQTSILIGPEVCLSGPQNK